MMVLCKNKSCLNNSVAGCNIAAIAIDPNGVCECRKYPNGYWDKFEEGELEN